MPTSEHTVSTYICHIGCSTSVLRLLYLPPIKMDSGLNAQRQPDSGHELEKVPAWEWRRNCGQDKKGADSKKKRSRTDNGTREIWIQPSEAED